MGRPKATQNREKQGREIERARESKIEREKREINAQNRQNAAIVLVIGKLHSLKTGRKTMYLCKHCMLPEMFIFIRVGFSRFFFFPGLLLWVFSASEIKYRIYNKRRLAHSRKKIWLARVFRLRDSRENGNCHLISYCCSTHYRDRIHGISVSQRKKIEIFFVLLNKLKFQLNAHANIFFLFSTDLIYKLHLDWFL